MLAPLESQNNAPGPEPFRRRLRLWLWAKATRFPFVSLFFLVFASNLLGSFFNIGYNYLLIVKCYMDEHQQDVFQHVASPLYNIVAYPAGIGLTIWLILPLVRCRKRLRAGQEVAPAQMEICRRRLVNLPFYQVCINFLGWLPGAVVFPLLVCWLGGTYNAGPIWVQFVLSFCVSALLTTAGTFFLLEVYLIACFYPDFFQGARPSQVHGTIRVSFAWRLVLLGSAVAAPLLALWLVAISISDVRGQGDQLKILAHFVTVGGAVSAGLIFWLVGRDLSNWVSAHAKATEQVELDNLDIHILQQRPDEWGLLTDRFNDMVAALTRGRQERETFGEFVGGPDVRDDIMQNYPGLGGEVETITVLFADIRGFTRRSTGASPQYVVELLNRFLTLAANAIQKNAGFVNKFLGDGIMALFGVRQRRANHADQAISAAREMLARLRTFNQELIQRGEEPLQIGIGIHTGPALVGCIGATVTLADGSERMRREFTAIGETVNLAQRLEQLTKSCAGPILLSAQTQGHLQQQQQLQQLGPVAVPGYDKTLVVYRVEET
jgi:adenylate cyclase